jgi:hypothetical protein
VKTAVAVAIAAAAAVTVVGNAEDAFDGADCATDSGADSTSNHAADRTCNTVTLVCALLGAPHDTLRPYHLG